MDISTSGQWKGTAMFRKMTSRGLIPDIVTYNLFASLRRHGRSNEAAEVSHPNTVFLSSVYTVYASKEGLWMHTKHHPNTEENYQAGL
jgi:hypothetical protein